MTVAATAELYGTIDDSDQLLTIMINRHLPAGGSVLALLIFALGMSTIDSVLLALSASVSRDICHGLLRIERNQKAVLLFGRLTTLVFLILASLFAITAIGRGALVPWVTLGASIGTLLLWPFLGVFVWRRASATTVNAAMCLGFFAICITRFTELGELLPFGFATTGFLVGGLSFFVGGLVSGPRIGTAA